MKSYLERLRLTASPADVSIVLRLECLLGPLPFFSFGVCQKSDAVLGFSLIHYPWKQQLGPFLAVHLYLSSPFQQMHHHRRHLESTSYSETRFFAVHAY